MGSLVLKVEYQGRKRFDKTFRAGTSSRDRVLDPSTLQGGTSLGYLQKVFNGSRIGFDFIEEGVRLFLRNISITVNRQPFNADNLVITPGQCVAIRINDHGLILLCSVEHNGGNTQT